VVALLLVLSPTVTLLDIGQVPKLKAAGGGQHSGHGILGMVEERGVSAVECRRPLQQQG
jgi:hypothetical protein